MFYDAKVVFLAKEYYGTGWLDNFLVKTKIKSLVSTFQILREYFSNVLSIVPFTLKHINKAV